MSCISVVGALPVREVGRCDEWREFGGPAGRKRGGICTVDGAVDEDC